MRLFRKNLSNCTKYYLLNVFLTCVHFSMFQVVSVHQTSLRKVGYRYHMLQVSPAVFEAAGGGENMEDLPTFFLTAGHMVELDTYAITHGPTTKIHGKYAITRGLKPKYMVIISHGPTTKIHGKYISHVPTTKIHGKYISHVPTTKIHCKYISHVPTTKIHGNYISHVHTTKMHGKYISHVPATKIHGKYLSHGLTTKIHGEYISHGPTTKIHGKYISRGPTT